MHRVLKPDSFCIAFYGWNKIDRFMAAWREFGFTPVGHFVGVKRYASSAGFTAMHHECAYLLAKGRPDKPKQPISDVLPWVYTGNPLHPTQKPVPTLVPLIEAYSKPGDIVLDPFGGSGSTGIAAISCHRRFILIEKDARYAQAAKERLEDYRAMIEAAQPPTTHPRAAFQEKIPERCLLARWGTARILRGPHMRRLRMAHGKASRRIAPAEPSLPCFGSASPYRHAPAAVSPSGRFIPLPAPGEERE